MIRSTLALTFCLLFSSSISPAQQQASCTYTFFPTQFSTPPLSNLAVFTPFGVNDFSTVVGGAFQTGFVRWANGGFTFPAGTGSLSDRNDNGVSIGYDLGNNPLLVNGSAITPVTVAIGASTVAGPGLVVSRINNWGSIVGWYGDNSGIARGYKRWANGHGFNLDFPAHFTQINAGTFPTGINDQGMIVGFTQIPYHAFLYYKGKWTTIKYPNSIATWLWGISNAGVMLGTAEFRDGSTTGFLYKNGNFENITLPGTVGSGVGSHVIAISLRMGLILGTAEFHNSAGQGFIAKCQ